MIIGLLFIGSFLVTFSPVLSLSCIPCSWVRCSTPVNCKGGLVKSICGCCSVCAKVEGEQCGGQWQTLGRCDSGLKCVVRDGRLKAGAGTCEPAVCKGKKCGFREVCTLGNDGFPICTCPQACNGYKHKPVCGYSNGKQYNNECELHKEECQSAKIIGVMEGPCKKCFEGTRTYLFDETRTGKNPCEQCTCFHGEWKCRSTANCEPSKSRSCTSAMDTLGRTLQSDCPKGFWCKVQIPGIPEAGIPEVAVCTPGDPTNTGEAGSTSILTVSPQTSQLQGKVPLQCLLPPSEGPCRAAFRRWYYNKEKGKCMVFAYGGCEGNANNFNTKPACKRVCMQRNTSSEKAVKQTHPTEIGKTKTPEPPIAMWTEVCYLPPVTGPCRASFPRWYYNSLSKKCLKFTYGGCKGNMNNFHTKIDCKNHCMKRKGKTRARAAIWYGALRRRSSNYQKLSHG